MAPFCRRPPRTVDARERSRTGLDFATRDQRSVDDQVAEATLGVGDLQARAVHFDDPVVAHLSPTFRIEGGCVEHDLDLIVLRRSRNRFTGTHDPDELRLLLCSLVADEQAWPRLG